MSAFVHSTGNGKNKFLELYRTQVPENTTEIFYTPTNQSICEIEIPDIARYNVLILYWATNDGPLFNYLFVNEIEKYNDQIILQTSSQQGTQIVKINFTNNVLKIYADGTRNYVFCHNGTVFFLA